MFYDFDYAERYVSKGNLIGSVCKYLALYVNCTKKTPKKIMVLITHPQNERLNRDNLKYLLSF